MVQLGLGYTRLPLVKVQRISGICHSLPPFILCTALQCISRILVFPSAWRNWWAYSPVYAPLNAVPPFTVDIRSRVCGLMSSIWVFKDRDPLVDCTLLGGWGPVCGGDPLLAISLFWFEVWQNCKMRTCQQINVHNNSACAMLICAGWFNMWLQTS